jgi:adenosylmethionine-8-amino-7-oxononanoate aminotransferase
MSNLFYQAQGRRPVLDQARGVYMWDKDGKRYLDGSSGAMVCNIGHSNQEVLTAMRRQMEKSTFGYRLHFETEASEQLAQKLAGLMPGDLNRVFFVSGGSEAVESWPGNMPWPVIRAAAGKSSRVRPAIMAAHWAPWP